MKQDKKVGPCDAGLRATAAAAGENKYWTDHQCPSGHVGWRYVLNGGCVECQHLINLRTRARLREAMGMKPKRTSHKLRESVA